eukprot:3237403-Amphidinium_carterae.1
MWGSCLQFERTSSKERRNIERFLGVLPAGSRRGNGWVKQLMEKSAHTLHYMTYTHTKFVLAATIHKGCSMFEEFLVFRPCHAMQCACTVRESCGSSQ